MFASMAIASEVNVQATVDRNQMYTGDTFTVTVSISAEGNVNVEPPRLPNIQDFDLLKNWTGEEFRSNFINGKFVTNRTKNFSYLLAPKKAGTFNLGEFSVVANGQTLKTQPIAIAVKQGTAPSQNIARPRRQRQVDPFAQMEEEMDDLFNQMLLRRRGGGLNVPPPENINPDDVFFLNVAVDKDDVYVGEQVTVSWYIYTRHNLTNIQNLKFPDLKGFWKEDIEVVTNLNYTNEVINGVVYRKALLASYALFPIKAGKAVIDPYRVKCKFRQPGILGFRETDYIAKQSQTKTINVRALPLAGKPDSFTGGVGQFEMTSSLSQGEIRQNEPLTLNIKFSGRGNAKRIDLPELNLPEGIELYDSKGSAKFYKNGSSHKDFELFIIPRNSGEVTLPSIEFSFYDPVEKKYYTKKTPEKLINVKKAEQTQVIAQSRVETQLAGSQPQADILPAPILEWQAGFRINEFQRIVLWTFLASMVFLFLLWKGFVEFEVFNQHHGIELDLKKRVTTLMSEASKGNWRDVGIEGSNLIYFLLGELSGQGGASRQAQKLIDLCPPSVRRELGDEYLKQLKVFEELAFAPEQVVKGKTDTKNLKAIIKQLDKLCKSTIKMASSEKT